MIDFEWCVLMLTLGLPAGAVIGWAVWPVVRRMWKG